jgi:hypothetical protein
MPRATFMWLLERNLSFNRFIIDQLNERLWQFVGLAQRDRLLDPGPQATLHAFRSCDRSWCLSFMLSALRYTS